jgi:hypothetical protein
MTYDVDQDLMHTWNVIAAIWFSFIQNMLIGEPSLKMNTSVMDSLCLPSMSAYFPMTIISIDTYKQLMNHTASKISLNEGGVNLNHLHHLQHTSVNAVALAGDSDNLSSLFRSDSGVIDSSGYRLTKHSS